MTQQIDRQIQAPRGQRIADREAGLEEIDQIGNQSSPLRRRTIADVKPGGFPVPRTSPLIVLLCALALIASACGSDGTTDLAVADDSDAQSQPDTEGDASGDSAGEPIPVEPDGGIGDGAEPLPGAGDSNGDDGGPIPVEPDGGIGDGAEPLPGAETPEDTGTWHGAEVAETNCPRTEWKRVEASAFSFSVPVDFTEADVQPIDSEVGVWAGGNNIEVSYDYGWYSGSINSTPGAENEPIDYSGITGELTIVRADGESMIGVLFPEVVVVDGQADRLGLTVRFADVNDEIVGRCIVGSITFG